MEFSEKIFTKDYEECDEDYKVPNVIAFTDYEIFFSVMVFSFIIAIAFFWLGTITEKSEAINAGAAEMVNGKFVYKNFNN